MDTATKFAPIHFFALMVLTHIFPYKTGFNDNQVLRSTATGKRIPGKRRLTDCVRNRPALPQAGRRVLQSSE